LGEETSVVLGGKGLVLFHVGNDEAHSTAPVVLAASLWLVQVGATTVLV